jgi:hypothetical protein
MFLTVCRRVGELVLYRSSRRGPLSLLQMLTMADDGPARTLHWSPRGHGFIRRLTSRRSRDTMGPTKPACTDDDESRTHTHTHTHTHTLASDTTNTTDTTESNSIDYSSDPGLVPRERRLLKYIAYLHDEHIVARRFNDGGATYYQVHVWTRSMSSRRRRPFSFARSNSIIPYPGGINNVNLNMIARDLLVDVVCNPKEHPHVALIVDGVPSHLMVGKEESTIDAIHRVLAI